MPPKKPTQLLYNYVHTATYIPFMYTIITFLCSYATGENSFVVNHVMYKLN